MHAGFLLQVACGGVLLQEGGEGEGGRETRHCERVCVHAVCKCLSGFFSFMLGEAKRKKVRK